MAAKQKRILLAQSVCQISGCYLYTLFPRFTINVTYARNIDGIYFIYTILPMTMLLFLSVFYYKLIHGVSYLIYSHDHTCKLFAKSIVIVVVATEEANACE